MLLHRIQDRDGCGKDKGLHWGGTPHNKNIYWEGGHRTYFLDWVNNWGGEGGDTAHAHTLLIRGTIGVGTPHKIESKGLYY